MVKKQIFIFLAALALIVPASANVVTLRDQVLSPDPAVSGPALDQIAGLDARRDKKLLVLSLASYLTRDPAAARAIARCGPEAAAALPELMDALRMDDPEIARASAETIIQIGAPSMKPLIKALNDGNFVLRQRSAEILGAMGPTAAKAAPELVDLLQDPQFQVQTAAQNALLKIGDPAVPAIMAQLKRSDAPARKQMVTFLPRLGKASAPALIQALQKDDNPQVRVAAANALGEVRPVQPGVVPALIAALKTTDDSVRTAAVNALGSIGAEAKLAIGPLIVISREDSEALARQRSLQALERIGVGTKESLPGFLDGMRAKDAVTRKDILIAVGQADIPADQIAALLALAVKDPDATVRMQSIVVAAAKAPKESRMIPVLHSAVLDGEPPNRTAAIIALSDAVSDPAAAAQAIEDGFKNPSMSTRQTCILALAKLGPPAIPILIKATGDSSSLLAEQAETAILQMGSQAVPVLERISNGSDVALKAKADELLTRLTGRPKTQTPAATPAKGKTTKKK